MSAWYIKTRAEFHDVLSRTLAMARRRRAASALWLHARIEEELEAMRTWTAAGRTPTPEERKRIDIGLIAIREMDAQTSDEEAEFMNCLIQLAGYFDRWPDDPPPGSDATRVVPAATAEQLAAGLELLANRKLTLMTASAHLDPAQATPEALQAMLADDTRAVRLSGLRDEFNPLVLDPQKVAAFVAGLPRLPEPVLRRLEGRFLPLHGEGMQLSVASVVEWSVIASWFELVLPDEDGVVVQPQLRVTPRRAFAEEVVARAESALRAVEQELRELERANAAYATIANARWRRFAVALVWREAASTLAVLDPRFRESAEQAAGAAISYVMPPWVGMPRRR